MIPRVWAKLLCRNSRKDPNGMFCCSSFERSWFKLRLFTHVKIWSWKSTENLFQNLATVAVLSKVLCRNNRKDPNGTLLELIWTFITLHEKPYFLFPNVLKRWSFQKNRTGIWSFLYHQETGKMIFLFPENMILFFRRKI